MGKRHWYKPTTIVVGHLVLLATQEGHFRQGTVQRKDPGGNIAAGCQHRI
jgi:hypothetical protein